MLGKHKFRVGQRVRPSADGKAAHIFMPKHRDRSGVVTKVDEFNSLTVLWDHRKTGGRYHPDFIEPDRRRRAQEDDNAAETL